MSDHDYQQKKEIADEAIELAEQYRQPDLAKVRQGEDSIYQADTRLWSEFHYQNYLAELNQNIRQYDEYIAQYEAETRRVRNLLKTHKADQWVTRKIDPDEEYQNWKDNQLANG